MEIRNTPYIPSTGNLQNIAAKAAAENTNSVNPAAQRDSVMFSAEALRRSEVAPNNESPRIRFDLVNRLKAEIAAGTYEIGRAHV
jgi:anti-sigma28 factor (negative regulator of flagellin synthesis)